MESPPCDSNCQRRTTVEWIDRMMWIGNRIISGSQITLDSSSRWEFVWIRSRRHSNERLLQFWLNRNHFLDEACGPLIRIIKGDKSKRTRWMHRSDGEHTENAMGFLCWVHERWAHQFQLKVKTVYFGCSSSPHKREKKGRQTRGRCDLVTHTLCTADIRTRQMLPLYLRLRLRAHKHTIDSW